MKAADPWTLVDALRQAEAERGLTARSAARAAGVPAGTYLNIHAGRRSPSLPTALRLADFIGRPIRDLVRFY